MKNKSNKKSAFTSMFWANTPVLVGPSVPKANPKAKPKKAK